MRNKRIARNSSEEESIHYYNALCSCCGLSSSCPDNAACIQHYVVVSTMPEVASTISFACISDTLGHPYTYRDYRNSLIFCSQIFHARNFHVKIFSSLAVALHTKLLWREIFVLKYFRQLAPDENILTTKKSRITVLVLTHAAIPSRR